MKYYIYPSWPDIKPCNFSDTSLPPVLMDLLVYIVCVENEQINIVFISNSLLHPNHWSINFTSLSRWCLLKQNNLSLKLKTLLSCRLLLLSAYNSVLDGDTLNWPEKNSKSWWLWWWLVVLVVVDVTPLPWWEQLCWGSEGQIKTRLVVPWTCPECRP